MDGCIMMTGTHGTRGNAIHDYISAQEGFQSRPCMDGGAFG